MPLGRRSDTGPSRQKTGGMGFVALGNDDVEMKVCRTGTLEVEHKAQGSRKEQANSVSSQWV